MRKSSLIIFSLVLALIVAGCSSTKHDSETLDGPASVKERFETLSDLTDRATNIVEVSILDKAETVEYGQVFFTISQAKVLSSLKGDITPNTEIRIIETGGSMPNGQEFKFNGIPVVKKGEHLFLFVEKYVGPVAQNAYVPLGVYQGKFKVQGDNVIQQTTPDLKIKDYDQAISKAKFKDDVKAKIK